MIKVQRTFNYTTSDGRVFADRETARNYEARKQLLDGCLKHCPERAQITQNQKSLLAAFMVEEVDAFTKVLHTVQEILEGGHEMETSPRSGTSILIWVRKRGGYLFRIG